MSHPNRKLVAEFHEAFEVTTPAERSETPSLPPLDPEDRRDLKFLAVRIQEAAEAAHSFAEQTPTSARHAFLRVQLMAEELAEVVDAMSNYDITEVAHELADLEYVVQGTVLAFGFDTTHEDCVAEIHRANMSKLENGKPLTNEAGRVVKGKDFRPACVRDILFARRRAS